MMKKKPSLSPSRDFDSPTHPPDSFHSPLRSDLGDSADTPPYASPAASPHQRSAVDEPSRFSPLPSPLQDAQKHQPRPPPEEEKELASGAGSTAEESDVSLPAVVLSRARGEGTAPSTRVAGGRGGRAAQVVRMRRPRALERLKRAGLCLRVSEMVLCIISFSVMAADKTKGWSGDSYDRYKEYRYCLSVNVIAFVYAGFQASELAFRLRTGKQVFHDQIHYYFDFFMDQASISRM